MFLFKYLDTLPKLYHFMWSYHYIISNELCIPTDHFIDLDKKTQPAPLSSLAHKKCKVLLTHLAHVLRSL